MKISIITYGIGRGGNSTISNLEKIYRKISSLHDTQYLYIFNAHKHQFSENIVTDAKVTLLDCWTPRVEQQYQKSLLFEDPYRNGYVSMKNLLQQFEMLESGLGQTSRFNPDYILYLRDDILINPLAVVNTLNHVIKRKKIWFSAFHGNCGYCERFGILPRDSIQLLARFSYINGYYNNMHSLSYVLRKGLNGEWLYRYIIDQHKTKFICNYIKSTRIRENGRKVRERVVPRPWHLNSEWQIFKGVLRYYIND